MEKIIIDSQRFQSALSLAVAAHKEQVRKTDGSPYVVHPIMVARLVEQHGFGETAVLAALVHDVIEDTNVSEGELREKLGDEVVAIVTAVSEDKNLPWHERKEQYIDTVVTASDEVKAVSVADKIHNAESLIDFHTKHGAATWEKFSQPRDEKLWFERELCTRLQAVWQHPLLDQYEQLVTHLEALD